MNSDLSFRLVGVERRPSDRSCDPDYAVVTYGVRRNVANATEWLLPVSLLSGRVADGDLTKVARSHLAHMFEALATETADWRLSTEWFEENVTGDPEMAKRRIG